MQRALVAPLVAAALAAPAAAGPQPTFVVRADGRIGPLRIDVSTERDVHVALGPPIAVRREARPVEPGCGEGRYLRLRRDARHTFVVTLSGGRVVELDYFGPHSLRTRVLC